MTAMRFFLRFCFAAMLIAGNDLAARDMLPLLPASERAKWYAVGAVNAAGFKTKASCSGALVAPDLVLTAAHCVDGGAPRHFVAGLALDGHRAHSASAEFMVHPAYALAKGNARFQYDIALIRLAEPIAANLVSPLVVDDRLTAQNGPFSVVGYSRFRPYLASGRFDCMRTNGIKSLALYLDCPATSGNSGAPVLVQTKDGWRIVAVLIATLDQGGSARSLAVPVLDWVVQEIDKAKQRAN